MVGYLCAAEKWTCSEGASFTSQVSCYSKVPRIKAVWLIQIRPAWMCQVVEQTLQIEPTTDLFQEPKKQNSFQNLHLAILCDLFGMVKLPFQLLVTSLVGGHQQVHNLNQVPRPQKSSTNLRPAMSPNSPSPLRTLGHFTAHAWYRSTISTTARTGGQGHCRRHRAELQAWPFFKKNKTGRDKEKKSYTYV